MKWSDKPAGLDIGEDAAEVLGAKLGESSKANPAANFGKRVFIQTLGCAMNVRDSEHMIAQLKAEQGYELTEDIKDADLILINTCSVREKPVAKLFSELGVFEKQRKKGSKIGVCGCTASHLGKDIFKRAPKVDFVLGARNVSKISEAVNTPKFISNDINYDESDFAFADFRNSIYKSFINITMGCDKHCSYCIVPHTRGQELSIPFRIIFAEAQRAVEKGAREIFLLGQNVNNYGKRFSSAHEKMDFADLLNKLSEIKHLRRIRFTSPHPLHMDDKFLETFATNPKICKAMHMPMQSGSSRILNAMKRGYTREWYLNRAQKLRALCPQASISTDIIVGFPGESDFDFEQTMEMVELLRFEQIFSFKYSKRPLTPAASMSEQVDAKIAQARLKRLQELHSFHLDEIMLSQKARQAEVFFEELRENGSIAGRTDDNFLVQVQGSEELLGRFANVKVIEPKRMVLYGQIVA